MVRKVKLMLPKSTLSFDLQKGVLAHGFKVTDRERFMNNKFSNIFQKNICLTNRCDVRLLKFLKCRRFYKSIDYPKSQYSAKHP